jgi:hypothetical protein
MVLLFERQSGTILEDTGIVYFKLGIDSRCYWNRGRQVSLKIDLLIKFHFDCNNFLYDVLIIFKNI